ncbi:MAG: putative baseplate assembly protein [Verrucomicrobiales bacterium]|nr:putative baseplate assembly protein [Verrucomicrobiales bacterium]
MSLPTQNLDDRDWASLVDEARRRIAIKCPNWTDFNPSDPGMMLVELMAWMTETVLYRLNRVPEKNYLKFLDLIGVRIQPARAARTWVYFRVPENVDDQDSKLVVPKGVRLSTRAMGNQEPIAFRTCEDLVLTSQPIIGTRSIYRVSEAPLPALAIIHNLHAEEPWETEIFGRSVAGPSTGQAVPHHFYLGAPKLAEAGEAIELSVLLDLENPKGAAGHLEWEAWDGQTWQPIVPVADGTQGLTRSGKVTFGMLPELKPLTVEGLRQQRKDEQNGTPLKSAGGTPPKDGPQWLRARLTGASSDDISAVTFREPRRERGFKACTKVLEAAFCGVPPVEIELPGTERPAFVPPIAWPVQPLELNQDFHPFGTRPRSGSVFYLSSSLFARHAAIIRLQFEIRTPLPRDATPVVHWEFLAGDQGWRPLGGSDTTGATSAEYEWVDGTQAFTRGGRCQVQFRCPRELLPGAVAGRDGSFVRARLESYQHELAPDIGLVVRSVLVGFQGEIRPWDFCLCENYANLEEPAAGSEFRPFIIDPTHDPAFYVGFRKPPSPSRGVYRLYLDVVPQAPDPLGTKMGDSDPDEAIWSQAEWLEQIARLRKPPLSEDLTSARAGIASSGWRTTESRSVVAPRGAQLIWEYSGPDGWHSLKVHGKDTTEGLAHEGAIEFASPTDWEERSDIGQPGYWLRVRWVVAEYLRPPRLRRVAVNMAEVEQVISRERVLDSSDSSPNQGFSLRSGILERPQVWIRESKDLSEAEALAGELEASGYVGGVRKDSEEYPLREISPSGGSKPGGAWTGCPEGCWIRWTEVRNFFRSGPTDRHFTADLASGTIVFGDGMHGAIPPASRNGDALSPNVRIAYRVTSGAAGNVGAKTITVLDTKVAGVQEVLNYHPASGGADQETIAEAKARGPWAIKHRDRAVTAEDYERLALKATPAVGRASCYLEGGIIRVVIVPKDSRPRPRPGQRVIRDVYEYLDSRRMINTRLEVVGPEYEGIDLRIALVLNPQATARFGEIVHKAEASLRDFVHPLKGATNGAGWSMGRTLHLSELYYRLEQVDEIDHVTQLEMVRTVPGLAEKDRIPIGPRSYPVFESISFRQDFD